MSPQGSRTGWLPAVAGIGLLILVWLVANGIGAGPVDDTYIFLRYAENLVDGHGLVFNPGERVEGFTSPVWVLVVAAAILPGLDSVTAATWLALIAAAAAAAVVFAEGLRRLPQGTRALALLPAAFVATSPVLCFWAGTGMDTAAFTLSTTLALVLVVRAAEGGGSPVVAGLAVAVAIATRLEAVALLAVFLPAIALGAAPSERFRRCLRFTAPLACVGVLLLARFAYYGTWLPNTFHAKLGVDRGVLVERGFDYLLSFAAAHWVPLVLAAAAVALIGVRRRRLAGAAWIVPSTLLVWGAVVTGIGGDHFALYRFFAPVIPMIGLAMLLGLAELGEGGRSRRAVVVAAVAAALLAWSAWRVESKHGGEVARGEAARARAWSEVGRWFERNTPADATLASIVVGAIPYHAERVTYDLLGLTDRVVAVEGRVWRQGAIGHQRYHTDYILERKPEYIVFNQSGLYGEPLRKVGTVFEYALYHLARDPRTPGLYEYHWARMPNGRVVEFLKLRDGRDAEHGIAGGPVDEPDLDAGKRRP